MSSRKGVRGSARQTSYACAAGTAGTGPRRAGCAYISRTARGGRGFELRKGRCASWRRSERHVRYRGRAEGRRHAARNAERVGRHETARTHNSRRTPAIDPGARQQEGNAERLAPVQPDYARNSRSRHRLVVRRLSPAPHPEHSSCRRTLSGIRHRRYDNAVAGVGAFLMPADAQWNGTLVEFVRLDGTRASLSDADLEMWVESFPVERVWGDFRHRHRSCYPASRSAVCGIRAPRDSLGNRERIRPRRGRSP